MGCLLVMLLQELVERVGRLKTSAPPSVLVTQRPRRSDTYRLRAIVETDTEDAVGSIPPDVGVQLALVGGRADGGAVGIDTFGIDGIAIGWCRNGNVGDLSGSDSGVERVDPLSRKCVGIWGGRRIRVEPF